MVTKAISIVSSPTNIKMLVVLIVMGIVLIRKKTLISTLKSLLVSRFLRIKDMEEVSLTLLFRD